VCFLFGFYNFCISLAVCFAILGYIARHQDSLNWRNGVVLSLLFVVTYFTHLLGFLFAAACAIWMSQSSARRLHNAGVIALACYPSLMLTIDYFVLTRFTGESGATVRLWGWLRQLDVHLVWDDALNIIDRLLPQFVTSSFVLSLLVALQLQAMVAACAISFIAGDASKVNTGGVRQLLVMSFAFLLLYFLAPDFLGEHGGFLKMRIILPATLFLLVALVANAPQPINRALTCAAVVAACLNLAVVNQHFEAQNKEIAEFTAGASHIGKQQILMVVGDTSTHSLTRPSAIVHAYGYYGLINGHIALDNYEAVRSHFPVRFRQGVSRSRNKVHGYKNLELVDVILAWDCLPWETGSFPKRFKEVFRSGRLAVFQAPRNTF
jgi:hypothetical protein